VPVQRCTVHKHRNLFAHAPERLHDEITADYNDMIYATTSEEIEVRRKAFIRKWRLKHRAVADSLEEAGDRLFTFARLPPSQWRSVRTTNAIERLHEEFKRRIKTQTVLPSADTAAMLFWALLASGQINMRARSLNCTGPYFFSFFKTYHWSSLDIGIWIISFRTRI
jgi:putative transposase